MNEPFIPSLELCDSLVEGFGPSICNRGAVLQDEMDLLIAIIQLFPITVAIMIIASGLFYAIPRPER